MTIFAYDRQRDVAHIMPARESQFALCGSDRGPIWTGWFGKTPNRLVCEDCLKAAAQIERTLAECGPP